MTSLELAQYLHAHPDVFSDVLERLLAEPALPSGGSATFKAFGMHKTKRGDDDDSDDDDGPNKAPRAELIDVIHDVLVEDNRTEIINIMFDQATRKPAMFQALIHLALVNKNLRKEVLAKIVLLETRIDVVDVYCRGALQFAGRDRSLLALYLERLKVYAPAVYRVWLLLLDHPRLAGKTQRMLKVANESGLLDDKILSNGRDPLASLVCLFVDSNSSDSFISREDVEWLLTMVSDMSLALIFQFGIEASIVRRPIYDFMRFLEICERRATLGSSGFGKILTDYFIILTPVHQRHIEWQGDYHLYMHRILQINDATTKPSMKPWKRICETRPFEAQAIFVELLKTVTVGHWQGGLENFLYYLFKTKLRRAIPFETAATGQIHDIMPFTHVLLEMQQILARGFSSEFAMRVCVRTALQCVVHPAFDPKVTRQLLDMAPGFLASGQLSVLYQLEQAILHGNENLVKFWFNDIWPTVQGMLATECDWTTMMKPLLNARLIQRHDSDGTLQARLFDALAPWFVVFPLPIDWNWNTNHICYMVGDALFEKLDVLSGGIAAWTDVVMYHRSFVAWRAKTEGELLAGLGIASPINAKTQNYTAEAQKRTDALATALFAPLEPWAVRALVRHALDTGHAERVDNLLDANSDEKCNPSAIWTCLTSVGGRQDFDTAIHFQYRHSFLERLVEEVDNPLVMLGLLRRHMSASDFHDIVHTSIVHFLNENKNKNVADTSIDTTCFILRNLLMDNLEDANEDPDPMDEDSSSEEEVETSYWDIFSFLGTRPDPPKSPKKAKPPAAPLVSGEWSTTESTIADGTVANITTPLLNLLTATQNLKLEFKNLQS
jgi:hypothetical protein